MDEDLEDRGAVERHALIVAAMERLAADQTPTAPEAVAVARLRALAPNAVARSADVAAVLAMDRLTCATDG